MKKVLVVEDNEYNLYLTRYILENNGYQVVEVREGLKGVEMVEQERPDLIIMDIQLPDINGLEAVRRIRAKRTGQDVPIVAVSSYAMVGDREKALEAGCTGYITKPIDPETFAAEIDKYL